MTENLDEIVNDMTGNSKKNVGGGYRKMRKAFLKEKGKKPASTSEEQLDDYEEKIVQSCSANINRNDILSSEEEISKEKKTSRKKKKKQRCKTG